MPHDICVLPPQYTAEQASDHNLHQHLTKKKAHEREEAGLIVRIDVAGTRYVERGGAGVPRPRTFKNFPSATSLTRETIERAVGGPGETDAENAGRRNAKRRIEEFGAELVKVPHLTFDHLDVWIRNPERGEPVRARLRHRSEKVAARVKQYLALCHGTLRLDSATSLREFDAVLRKRRWELPAATRLLRRVWPEVVVRINAGNFSGPMTFMPPEKLPVAVVFWVFQAYLRE
jgi:hypothetical protein